jgi:hypothetical protein
MIAGQPIFVPSEVDLKLRLGICRLLDAKYRPHFGSQSKFLCAGIVNWVFLESPDNEEAKKFLEINQGLVEQEAKNLHLDADLALALSVLYTFMLIRLGPKDPERSSALVERATEVNIVIHSTQELYPGADAFQFLAFVDDFADRLLGGSPKPGSASTEIV